MRQLSLIQNRYLRPKGKINNGPTFNKHILVFVFEATKQVVQKRLNVNSWICEYLTPDRKVSLSAPFFRYFCGVIRINKPKNEKCSTNIQAKACH